MPKAVVKIAGRLVLVRRQHPQRGRIEGAAGDAPLALIRLKALERDALVIKQKVRIGQREGGGGRLRKHDPIAAVRDARPLGRARRVAEQVALILHVDSAPHVLASGGEVAAGQLQGRIGAHKYVHVGFQVQGAARRQRERAPRQVQVLGHVILRVGLETEGHAVIGALVEYDGRTEGANEAAPDVHGGTTHDGRLAGNGNGEGVDRGQVAGGRRHRGGQGGGSKAGVGAGSPGIHRVEAGRQGYPVHGQGDGLATADYEIRPGLGYLYQQSVVGVIIGHRKDSCRTVVLVGRGARHIRGVGRRLEVANGKMLLAASRHERASHPLPASPVVPESAGVGGGNGYYLVHLSQ